MPFKSLNQVLSIVENQPIWQERQQFQKLLRRWSVLVGEMVAAQTRPIAIQRGVLKVATSNGVWAQTLTFERLRLLEKLNAELSLSLQDIRFSTAHWSGNARSEKLDTTQDSPLWQQHPSRISTSTQQPPVSEHHVPPSPEAAFQRWATLVQSQGRSLPLCPACHCPSPSRELERWSVCSLCAAKQWKS